jgi:acyl-CoA thioester hydrolase
LNPPEGAVHRFCLAHRVSHADVDLLGELKTSALLGLLEQTAVEASTDAGFDPGWYTRAGRVWLIRRTRLERLLPVGGGDLVEVESSVADWRRARSLRRYAVRLRTPGRGIRDAAAEALARTADGSPAEVARATTDWVYCDLASGRPASVPPDVRRAFSGETLGETRPRARPLPERAEGDPVETRLFARPSHLDHVAHVNNAAYASFLEDAAFALFAARGLALDRMLARGGALRCRSLDIEYLVDALPGDELVVRSWVTGDTGSRVPLEAPTAETAVLQAIERCDGTLLVRAASTWIWRKRPAILGGAPGPPVLDEPLRRCLRLWVDRVVATLGENVEAVWLFGSAARGERWPSGMSMRSDVDVLVTTRLAVPPPVVQSLASETYEPFLESGRQISPQFRTAAELEAQKDERGAAFLDALRRDAVTLWQRAEAC